MIDAIEIGYVIKDRRAELGLTQAQLAEAAGISKRCLWSLELGQNPGVQLDKLTAVLGALGLDLAISTTDVAEPIAGTTSSSAQPESHTTANALPNTSPSQHTSYTDPGISSGTAKATEDNTASDIAKTTAGNTGGTIDALSILTGNMR